MGKDKLYVQISAGRGPAECSWVVAKVLKVFINYLKGKSLEYEIVSRQEGQQNRTLNSVLILVKGKKLSSILKEWEGTVQWIGKSPFRKFHKRKNWFIGVSFLEDSEEVKFNTNDLEYQTFRASGPGGQHRNKVETAVRVTHKSSGLSVTASDSKSQIQNKKNALLKMEALFKNYQLENIQNRTNEQWMEHLQLERGNPVKVFTERDFK